MSNIQSIARELRARLAALSIEQPEIVVRALICHVLDMTSVEMIAYPDRLIGEDERLKINALIERRIAGEPLSKILGEGEFWGLRFKVNEHVLDPRPDTETLIEAVLKRFEGGAPPGNILDLGTGSGCISITLLHEWKQSRADAVDLSEKAIEVAKQNAELNGVTDRITFIQSNWYDNLSQQYDLIVSNPPYITNQEVGNLAIEVKNHDPILALDGGIDGLDAYKKIFFNLKNYLKPLGVCFAEIGFDQEESVPRLAEKAGLCVQNIYRDLGGKPRVVEISFGENSENSTLLP